jgi:ComF family protein
MLEQRFSATHGTTIHETFLFHRYLDMLFLKPSMAATKLFIGPLVDFILPHLCPGCQTKMQTPGFCPSCWMKLDFITPPYCQLCANPSALSGKNLCRSCQADIPLFHSHRALWAYGSLSRRIVFALKHGRQRYLAHLIAPWLVPLALCHRVDFLVPVPLHPHRLAQRGFNQSALLASALSRLTGIPVAIEGLNRPYKASSQGRFSAQKRKENVMGIFTSSRDWDGQNILLIDDVFTTGATLNACTQALREANAHHVHGLTLAKVISG